ncbi:MAG: hypothetical protein RIC51_07905 [Erythrobacter sp.]|uniref:hypothetical protein n=1 Tax=Erythrobacter sp. TaxID=1042 RepID=UPI0032EB302E
MRQNRDEGAGWQLILADLALILFLVTLAALAGFPEGGSAKGEAGTGSGGSEARFAPSQALYRPGPDAPPLARWLARQARDPRATLTIYARHSGPEDSATWARARALAREARQAGVAVRVVIEGGDGTDGENGAQSGLHASLGYDSAPRRSGGS